MNNNINDENEFSEFSGDGTDESSSGESYDSPAESDHTSETQESYGFQSPGSSELDGDTKILCGVCHLGNILAAFTFIGGFISLVIYFLKPRDVDEAVNFHAKQSFIYFLAYLVLNIVIGVPSAILGTCLCFPFVLTFLVWLVPLVYAVYITVIVFMGQNYRIPLISDWADNFGS